MEEYEKDLMIDLQNLENNLKEQAAFVMKYGKLWAEKTKERDRQKENLTLIDSEIDSDTRKNWETLCPKIKLTEAAVRGYVVDTAKHKDANNTLLDLTEEVNVLSIAKLAFEHRKKALEGLVSLYIAGYWADPKVSKQNFDEIKTDELHKSVEKELNKNPRLRKKKPIKLRTKKKGGGK